MTFCRVVTKHLLKEYLQKWLLYLNSRVRKCALDLQDEHVLAKLLKRYGCAPDANYHVGV